jgi:hypothetical protein
MAVEEISVLPPDRYFATRVSELIPEGGLKKRTSGGLKAVARLSVPVYVNFGLGGVNGQAELQRTMNFLAPSLLLSSAGVHTVRTPAPGRAIRILGFSVVVDPATTTAAGSMVYLYDATSTAVLDNIVALQTAATNTPFRSSAPLPGNGLLLPVNDVLAINLSAAATAGGVYVNVWGCEE